MLDVGLNLERKPKRHDTDAKYYIRLLNTEPL